MRKTEHRKATWRVDAHSDHPDRRSSLLRRGYTRYSADTMTDWWVEEFARRGWRLPADGEHFFLRRTLVKAHTARVPTKWRKRKTKKEKERQMKFHFTTEIDGVPMEVTAYRHKGEAETYSNPGVDEVFAIMAVHVPDADGMDLLSVMSGEVIDDLREAAEKDWKDE